MIYVLFVLLLYHKYITSFQISNYLEQYTNFLKLSNDIIPRNSQIETDLFTSWSKIYNNRHNYFIYAEKVNTETLNSFPKLWINLDNNEIDCTYNANVLSIKTNNTSNKLIFTYNILQSSLCKSNTKIIGGSSFEIFSLFSTFIYDTVEDYYILSSSHHQKCNINDLFTGEYIAECESSISSKQAMYCINMTIILDYEHYDAFSDFKNFELMLKHKKIKLNINENLNLSDNYYLSQISTDNYGNNIFCIKLKSNNYEYSKIKDTIVDMNWMNIQSKSKIKKKFNLIHNFSICDEDFNYYQNKTITTINNFDNIVLNRINPLLHLRNNLTSFKIKSYILSCIENNDIVMIGESHMRYNWDFLYYIYFSDTILNLPHKHESNFVLPYFIYESIIFYDNTATTLLKHTNITAKLTSNKGMKTIVVQSGTWDLAAWSPRNVNFNLKRGWRYLINALDFIIVSREKLLKSTTPLHIIILDTSMQLRGEQNYKSKGWRNNYAIPATNQFFFLELLKMLKSRNNYESINTDSNFIQSYKFINSYLKISIINSFTIMTNLEEFGAVCHDHALCRNHADLNLFEFTSPGIAVLNIIMNTICPNSDIQNKITSYNNLDIIHSDYIKFYIIFGGHKKFIPDNSTLINIMKRLSDDCLQSTHIIYPNSSYVKTDINELYNQCFNNLIITKMPQYELDQIKEGTPMLSIIDYDLFYIHDKFKLFMILNGKRHHLTCLPIGRAINEIKLISDVSFLYFTPLSSNICDNYKCAQIYPEGTLVMCLREIFIIKDNFKRSLPNMDTFYRLGLDISNVKHVHCHELHLIKTSDPCLAEFSSCL